MIYTRRARGRRLALVGLISAVALSLSACSTTTAVSPRPRVIKPKSVGGSAGVGPRVISKTAATSHAPPGAEVIALRDRVVTLKAISGRPSGGGLEITIELRVTIRNTSRKMILNRSRFFLLIAPGGDTFSPEAGSATRHFYDPIAADATRHGSIKFALPAGAAAGLHLLYRPEVPTEAVILSLPVKK